MRLSRALVAAVLLPASVSAQAIALGTHGNGRTCPFWDSKSKRSTHRRGFKEQRASSCARRSGLGLGLSMAYGSIRAMQGHLDISSTPDVGTTVTMTLTRAATSPAAAARS